MLLGSPPGHSTTESPMRRRAAALRSSPETVARWQELAFSQAQKKITLRRFRAALTTICSSSSAPLGRLFLSRPGHFQFSRYQVS